MEFVGLSWPKGERGEEDWLVRAVALALLLCHPELQNRTENGTMLSA